MKGRRFARGARARLVSCVWVCVASVAAAGSARAEDVAGGKAAAQVLFEQARALLEQGDFARACPKFAESQRLDPGIGTMLWLADCYENSGQTASAWVAFKEAAAAAALRHDARERVARDRAVALEPRLSTLTVKVARGAATTGLDVRRDGMPVGEGQWGLPVPVDPGSHAMSASAVGRQPWSSHVTVPSAPGPVEITVPLLEVLSTEPGAASENTEGAPAPLTLDEPVASVGTGQRRLGAAVGVAGVLGVGVGALFAFKAKSTYDASNQGGLCIDNRCNPAGRNDRDDADVMATVATVAVGVGAAAVATGLVVFFTAPHAAALAVAPSAQGGTMRVSVAW